jgi:hypothetical protein
MFDRRKELAVYWFNKASDLHGSAAALWVSLDPTIEKEIVARTDLPPGFSMRAATPLVYRVLCGLALELLFKATLVARRSAVPHTHDLVKLAGKAGLTVTRNWDGFDRLWKLGSALYWQSRA